MMREAGQSPSPDADPRISPSDPNIWTPIRLELLDWLRGKAPSLAPAYQGAVELLHAKGFPGKLHFVAHVVRDIYDYLPETLDASFRPIKLLDFANNMIKAIAEHWPGPLERAALHDRMHFQNGLVDESVAIPVAAYQAVHGLVNKYEDLTKQPTPSEVLAQALYRESGDDAGATPDWLIKTFKEERDWFVGRAHLRPRSTKTTSQDELMQHFRNFERTLQSFVGQYFSGTKELDVILQRANQRRD